MKEKIHVQMEIHDEEVDDVILIAQMNMKRVQRKSFFLKVGVLVLLFAGVINLMYGGYWLAILDAFVGLLSLWVIEKNKVEIKKCRIIEQSLKRYKEDKSELLK